MVGYLRFAIGIAWEKHLYPHTVSGSVQAKTFISLHIVMCEFHRCAQTKNIYILIPFVFVNAKTFISLHIVMCEFLRCAVHIWKYFYPHNVCACVSQICLSKKHSNPHKQSVYVCVSQIFTDVYRCFSDVYKRKKKHLYPPRSVAALSGVALSPLGGKKLDFALQ